MTLVGVVPAAGAATRLQPLDTSKEVLPVRGRPVMDHVVERMRAAACDEIRVVTRRDKEDVARHARELGVRVVVGTPESAAESVALGAEGLAPADTLLVGFPDTLWEPLDGFARLLPELTDGVAAVLGLFRTPDLRRSDVVVLAAGGVVEGVAVKPAEPPAKWIWGCAAVRAEALQAPARGDLGERFDELARSGAVRGVRLSHEWIDIGTPEGLQRALGKDPVPADRDAEALA